MEERFEQQRMNKAIDSQVRLDTTQVKSRIEQMLKGEFKLQKYDHKKDEIEVTNKQYGERLLNDKGIQTVMTLVESRISRHTALGNLQDRRFEKILERTRKSLALNLIPNRVEYSPENKKLSARDCQYVISVVMDFIEIFLTRALYDGERSHLDKTVQETTQTVREETDKGGLLGFGE